MDKSNGAIVMTNESSGEVFRAELLEDKKLIKLKLLRTFYINKF